MIQVNPHLVSAFLDPLAGLADDDESVETFSALNPDDEAEIRELIRSLLKPHYVNFTEESQERLRNALRYCLSAPEFNFERVFESTLPPFDPPSEPRQFFVWLWEVLFDGEEFTPIDLSGVQVHRNIHEANSLRTRNQ